MITHIFALVYRIKKIARDKNQATTLSFKNADGLSSSHTFKFTHVEATFKPVS